MKTFNGTVYSVLITLLFLDCIMTADNDTTGLNNQFNQFNRIDKVFIQIDQSKFEKLLENPESKEKIPQCFFSGVFGPDTCYLYCSVKLHGVFAREVPKLAFRVQFSQQKLESPFVFRNFPQKKYQSHSFSEIILHPTVIDFSHIRNFLSLYISTKIGATTQRIDFVRLYINEQFYGLYSIIERVDEAMVSLMAGHQNFDLLKGGTINANLKSKDKSDTTVSVLPSYGFELKYGDTKAFNEFVYWLESSKASYNKIKTKTDKSTLLSYFIACHYTEEFDGLDRNHYCIVDQVTGKLEILRWDAKSTLGRTSKGKKSSQSLSHRLEKNGLYQFLAKDPAWIKDLQQEFDHNFDRFLCADSILPIIDKLEKMLMESVYDDHILWKDTLLDFFVNQHEWDHWDDDPNDPLVIWYNDLNYIRKIIINRESEIQKEFVQ